MILVICWALLRIKEKKNQNCSYSQGVCVKIMNIIILSLKTERLCINDLPRAPKEPVFD